MKEQAIKDLCLRYLDGELTDQEAEAFNRLIAESQEAAAMLARLAIHDACFEVTATLATGHGAEDAGKTLAWFETVAAMEPEPEEERMSIRDFASLGGYVLRLALTSRPAMYAYPAAAVIMLAATLLIVYGGSGDVTPESQAGLGSGYQAQTDRPTAPNLPVVATLTAEQDAVWDRQPGQDLYPGQTFTLTQGLAEITTQRGAIAILHAPATIELIDSPNALRLHSGKIVGICETEFSKGFLVRTPHMDVTDLGTRFGVEADPAVATRVDVFVGEVSVAGTRDSDRQQPIELTAGLAVSADLRGELGVTEQAQVTRYYQDLRSYAAAPKVSGQGVYFGSPPSDLGLHVFQSSDAISIFMERPDLTWSEQLLPTELIGQGPTAGQSVDVFLAHFDPLPTQAFQGALGITREVVLIFDRPILGLITESERLHQTDQSLGAADSQYPDLDLSNDIGSRTRGLDDNTPVPDLWSISDDHRTLTLTFHAYGYLDQMRIIVDAATN